MNLSIKEESVNYESIHRVQTSTRGGGISKNLGCLNPEYDPDLSQTVILTSSDQGLAILHVVKIHSSPSE